MRNLIVCIYFMLPFIVCVAGCRKSNDIDNHSVTAEISGKYSPVEAAAAIMISPSGGGPGITAKLDSVGGYQVTGLMAGQYNISFEALPGFTAPGDIPLTLKAGEHADLGTVTFAKSAASAAYGSISGKISPAGAAANITATILFGTRPATAQINAAGQFIIDSLLPGDYSVAYTAAIGFTAPNNTGVKVEIGKNSDIGSISFSPIPVIPKSIDTITGNVSLNSAQWVNDFITRAAADSAIVITGYLWLSGQFVTPALAPALDKVIAIKQTLYIGTIAPTTLSLSGLKELRTLYVNGNSQLSTLNLSALKSITGGIMLVSCPLLTNLQIGALKELSGSLMLRGTGFSDLSVFSRVKFKPYNIDLQGNQYLKSISQLDFASDSVNDFTVRYNPVLISLTGMQPIKKFRNETVITNNTALRDLSGLDNITAARQLTLTNNPLLEEVCGAKGIINILKDAPPYQVRSRDPLTGRNYTVTVQPLVANTNGSHTTREDLVNAIKQCPG